MPYPGSCSSTVMDFERDLEAVERGLDLLWNGHHGLLHAYCGALAVETESVQTEPTDEGTALAAGWTVHYLRMLSYFLLALARGGGHRDNLCRCGRGTGKR